jgi:hypothetical protein
MHLLRWKLLPLGLLACSGLVLVATSSVRASDDLGPDSVVEEPPLVDLAELRRDPLPWNGREVRLVLQYQGLVPDWDPHLTRFGTTDWVAFSGWSDERFTWNAVVFEDSLPTMFVRRESELAEQLADFLPYERFEATAVVREIFLDRPWIEVTAIRPVTGLVGEGTILHVGRARNFMRKQQWDLALQQFERAKAAPLPAHALAELDRQIIECNRAQEAGGRKR